MPFPHFPSAENVILEWVCVIPLHGFPLFHACEFVSSIFSSCILNLVQYDIILCVYFCNLLFHLTLHMQYIRVDVCAGIPSVLLYGVQELYSIAHSFSLILGSFPYFLALLLNNVAVNMGSVFSCPWWTASLGLYLAVKLLGQRVCARLTSLRVTRSFV